LFSGRFFHLILYCKAYLDEIHLSNIETMIDSLAMNIDYTTIWRNIRQAHEILPIYFDYNTAKKQVII